MATVGQLAKGGAWAGRLNMPQGALNNESALVGITAGTTRTQAGATALASEINRIDTSTAPAAQSTLGDGVVLPSAASGYDLIVWNNTANNIQLYANGSDTINGVAGATGIIMPPSSIYLLIAASTVSWGVDGVGAGASGQFPTVTAIDGLTAHAGGGQGSAFPIVTQMARFTTVATAADSAVLMPSKPGIQSITVTNAAAANSMNIFPATGEQINALGANAAFALAAGKTVNFVCYTAGQWHAVLSA